MYELVFTIGITISIALYSMYNITQTYKMILMQNTIYFYQDIINYTKSIAIKNKTTTHIYPLNGNWNNGVKIMYLDKIKILKMPIKKINITIQLHNFGDRNTIHVLPNGFTNNNGHFSFFYMSTYLYNPDSSQLHLLYFNKALRSYIVK